MRKIIMLLAVVFLPVIVLAQLPAKATSQNTKKSVVASEDDKKTAIIPKTQVITCPVVKDTWIYAFRPDSSYGRGFGWKDRTDPINDITVPKMFLGFGGADKKAILLQFDLSKLPKGKKAQKAVIKLYNDFAGSEAETKVDVKMVSQPWNETKVTWKTKPSWHTAVVGSASLTGAINYGQPGKWYEWDVTKMILVWMVKNGPNYGIVLDPQGDSGVDRDFVCKEDKGREKFFPVMVVTYENQAAVKKPVSKETK